MVAAATAGVIASGITLMKKHTRYLAEKAAATFGPDDGDEAQESTEPQAGSDGDAQENTEPQAASEGDAQESTEPQAGETSEESGGRTENVQTAEDTKTAEDIKTEEKTS